MSYETDYRALKNRCPECGHRLIMRANNRCTVILNETGKQGDDRPCRCNPHKR